MFKKLFSIILFFACLGLSNTANSTVIAESVAGVNQWGIIQFDHLGGDLTIDIFANKYTGGSKLGIIDSHLTLFVDDGSPLTAFTGKFLATNDDSNPAHSIDGSTSWLDSLLNITNLAEGSYLLAVSQQIFTGSINDPSRVYYIYRDYQITFSRDVYVSAIDGVLTSPEYYNTYVSLDDDEVFAVAGPATFVMLLLGLMTFIMVRKRRIRG